MLGAAAAVVVFHNHPSGDPSPSPDDVALTRRLAAAGELMGIPVVDHIVLGDAVLQLQGDWRAVTAHRSRVTFVESNLNTSRELRTGSANGSIHDVPPALLRLLLRHLRRHGARRPARCRSAARRAEGRARQPGGVRVRGRRAERVLRAGVSATKFRVHRARAPGTQHPAPRHATASHEHLSTPIRIAICPRSIFALIDRSALSPAGRDRAKALFQRLARPKRRFIRCRSRRCTCTKSVRSTRSSTSSARCSRSSGSAPIASSARR